MKLKDFATHAYLSMRGSTLPFTSTKTYDLISVNLKEKQRKRKIKNLSPLALTLLPLIYPSYLLDLHFFSFYFILFLFLLLLFFSFSYLFIFLVLSFPLFPLLDTWLHVIHSHKCTTCHAMCHSTPDASKNVKFRLSQKGTKFDGVTRFRETNSTVKSVLSSEIYKISDFQQRLSFYHFSEKLNFSRVLHELK